MINNLKSTSMNFLRLLPRWTLTIGGILPMVMHGLSIFHQWIIVFWIGFLVSGCQSNRLSVKCMKGYEDEKYKYRHYSGVLPFRYMAKPKEDDWRTGVFIQLYYMDDFIVIPTTILSQVPKEIQNDLKTYLIENMKRYYDEMMHNIPTTDDELRKLIDLKIQEIIHTFVDEAMQNPDMTYETLNIKFIKYIADKVNTYCKKFLQKYCQQEKRTKLQIKNAQNLFDSTQDMFKYKIYFEQMVSSMFSNKETTKDLLMDAFAKSTVHCDRPECTEARRCCLSLTRAEVEFLDKLYHSDHVDAATAAKIYLDYLGKSSYTTVETFLKEYERAKKQTVPAQEDDLSDILQNLASIGPLTSCPDTSKVTKSRNKQKRGKQTQAIPANKESKNIENAISKQKIQPLGLQLISSQSVYEKHPRVKKWERNIQDLLAYFQNVPDSSSDAKYKHVNINEEVIKTEKRRHDLSCVENILEESDSDNYFVFQESKTDPYARRKRRSYCAKARLECQEETHAIRQEEGMVDIGISQDTKQIFHLMFRKENQVEKILNFSKTNAAADDAAADDAADHNHGFQLVVKNNHRRFLYKDRDTNNYVTYIYDNEHASEPYKKLYIIPYKNAKG
ncbi:DUF1609 domain-containing protein [Candidatus Cardinium hertigii]|jgi:hypothetical protein|uniref:DUF1609 domain-containing protein n=1 Tax=Candidatus Cardinium hertigii TaxID=247481 RepID=A0A3N2QBN8_9BACT|nr:DUF1609 domain-containing protein [Candidatus Cardinium hertigii]ROT47002.1 DUF1609 domain-containing protein [Candidatus Cardinium hertigii]